ncbi:MAG: acetylglutamate kinase [Eubacterium sp.]|nr:acetylglutamate kinase [Eubacterium sp.]
MSEEKEFKLAASLIEALPYMHRFNKKVFVVKMGGEILKDKELLKSALDDISLLQTIGVNPVLIHTPGVRLNMTIVKALNAIGTRAVGLDVEDADVIHALLTDKVVPVLDPVSLNEDGELEEQNADKAAKEVAIRLQAEKLIILWDENGIYDEENKLQRSMTVMEARTLINSEVKMDDQARTAIEDSIYTLARGVGKVHFLDGKREHGLLLELFTDQGIGTEIYIQKED